MLESPTGNARPPVNVIAVTSGKGGVGKTNVAANLAVSLGARGNDVMLLDADLGLANVDVLLGLKPRYDLADVLDGATDLDGATLRGPGNIRVVPASSGKQSMIDMSPALQAAIIRAFSEIVDQPEYLLIDTAAGLSDCVARFVGAAQQAIVVVCEEPASLTDAYALIKVFSRHHGLSHFEIVTNQTRDDAAGRRLFDRLRRVSDEHLDVVLRHLGNVPSDAWLKRAVQRQRPVVDAYPGSRSGRAFDGIAAALERPRVPRGTPGNIQFFFERLLEPLPAAVGDRA